MYSAAGTPMNVPGAVLPGAEVELRIDVVSAYRGASIGGRNDVNAKLGPALKGTGTDGHGHGAA